MPSITSEIGIIDRSKLVPRRFDGRSGMLYTKRDSFWPYFKVKSNLGNEINDNQECNLQNSWVQDSEIQRSINNRAIDWLSSYLQQSVENTSFTSNEQRSEERNNNRNLNISSHSDGANIRGGQTFHCSRMFERIASPDRCRIQNSSESLNRSLTSNSRRASRRLAIPTSNLLDDDNSNDEQCHHGLVRRNGFPRNASVDFSSVQNINMNQRIFLRVPGETVRGSNVIDQSTSAMTPTAPLTTYTHDLCQRRSGLVERNASTNMESNYRQNLGSSWRGHAVNGNRCRDHDSFSRISTNSDSSQISVRYRSPLGAMSNSTQRNHSIVTIKGAQKLTDCQIDLLPISSYSHCTGFDISDRSNQDMENTCTICIDGFKDGEPIRHLPCAHKYHKMCIDTWLRKEASCPICKFDVKKFFE